MRQPSAPSRSRWPLVALLVLAASPASAQKWVNPDFDAHRLDCRDLGYPGANLIPADDSPITALLASRSGMVYGATSGKQSYLFLYDRSINKVRPLGKIAGARGVHHALVETADGALYVGGGLNVLAPVSLTQEFPSGFRAIEEQLWKDIAAPYKGYKGGALLRYEPAKADAAAYLVNDDCPLADRGIPVAGNGVYALQYDAASDTLAGISYPDAHLFTHHVKSGKSRDHGPLLARKVYSGPERAWRSVPRALWAADQGRFYTSGDDGLIVYFDPGQKKIVRTAMRLPGEYWEAWNYHGYPVVEQFVGTGDGRLFGSTSDGFLFELDLAKGRLASLGKPRVSRRVRAMAVGPDQRLYLICGEFEEACKLYSYGLDGREGFRSWGVLAVDRSPYYAKRAYQFDAMAVGLDGTLFLGESDRRASLFLFTPGAAGFSGGLNPHNPR